jgi:fermentation-respiration switch protein FrsA (DUF1100 family)
LPLLAAGVYAGVALYGAEQVTSRRRRLPEIAPEEIAADHEAVVFESRADALKLHGWWFPVRGAERALILIHGHGQNRHDKNWGSDAIARAFMRQSARGYSVLMFDLRGHGESAHSRQSYGVRERNDVLGAFDFVRSRGVAPGHIAMLGISYGASSMLMAAPEMPEAGPLVSDSAYAAIWPVIRAQIPSHSPLLARLRPAPGIRLAARLRDRIDLLAARPVAAVERVPERPILFIHGAEDDYVPPANAEALLAASANPASALWLVPGARHAETYYRAPDEYVRRVAAFFDAQMSSQQLRGRVNGAGATAPPLPAER